MSDLFDKAKNLLADNADTVEDVVDKIAGVVDDKTGGKHKDKVQQGAAKAKDAISQFVGDDAPREQAAKKPAKKPGAAEPADAPKARPTEPPTSTS